MDIQKLTDFFMWCTIINGGCLVFSSMMCMLVPDFVYNIHSKLFHITREAFNAILYSFIGLFKIFFIMFSLVPYIALLIIR